MTYREFKAGLFYKYHFVYLQSKSFVQFNSFHGVAQAKFEKAIILRTDAEYILERIKNRNLAEALCLVAQGYCQWEVGEILGRSERTIGRYIKEAEALFT